MTSTELHDTLVTSTEPLDMLETLFQALGWTAERQDDEITAVAPGKWRDYQLRCYWREEDRILQVACLTEIRVPETRRLAVYEGLGLINERVWMGHFDIWAEDHELLFRHGAYVEPETGLTVDHAELLVQAALTECERFYPVFQFIVWAGKRPAEALEAALMETVGEA
jgi:hypothetical protein